MNKIIVKSLNLFIKFSFFCVVVFAVSAQEKVIQKEKNVFDRCLKVITVSADKLQIVPEISKLSEQNHTAVFSLTDGKLSINCDGINQLVIVTTTNE